MKDTIQEGFVTLGRLEALVQKKGALPDRVRVGMQEKARQEHFGQVLPMEEIRELVRKAETVVRMPCACRWAMGKGEVRACYGISIGPEQWYRHIDMSSFGPLPDEGLESVDREEAIRQMEHLEEHGAVHTIWTMMTPFIGAICNCTLDDCLAMRTLSGIKVETMALPSLLLRWMKSSALDAASVRHSVSSRLSANGKIQGVTMQLLMRMRAMAAVYAETPVRPGRLLSFAGSSLGPLLFGRPLVQYGLCHAAQEERSQLYAIITIKQGVEACQCRQIRAGK